MTGEWTMTYQERVDFTALGSDRDARLVFSNTCIMTANVLRSNSYRGQTAAGVRITSSWVRGVIADVEHMRCEAVREIFLICRENSKDNKFNIGLDEDQIRTKQDRENRARDKYAA